MGGSWAFAPVLLGGYGEGGVNQDGSAYGGGGLVFGETVGCSAGGAYSRDIIAW
ncbi:MAG: hypothetical protein JWN09_2535 [Microbacteriaceae bacterium]|nr:hypothetical protein [Microbacteriaceae bacterium]